MLFKRLIPKIVVEWDENRKNYVSILTRNYNSLRKIGNPFNQIQIMQSNLVDEITLINRTSHFDERFVELVAVVAKEINTPLTVGGGISMKKHCHMLVEAGADKLLVARKSKDDSLVEYMSSTFGVQSTVLSFDYYESLQDVSKRVAELISCLERGFYGELVLNSISRDGKKNGPDLDFLRKIQHEVKIPIVIGCGLSRLEHFYEAFSAGANGVTTSTYLSNLDQSPKQIRAHLHSRGIHIRVRN